MADYFLQYSCMFDVGTAENAARAEVIRGELAAELDRHEGEMLGFEMEPHHGSGPGALWVHGDGHGEPEHVVRFVLRCAEALDLKGLWGFTWGLSCSQPRLDGFGGCVQLLDLAQRKAIDWIDCNHWLERHLAPRAPRGTLPAQGVA